MRRDFPPNLDSHEHGSPPALNAFVRLPGSTLRRFLYAPLGRNLVDPVASAIVAVWLVFLPRVAEFLYVVFTSQPLPQNLGHEWMLSFAAAYLAASLMHWSWRWADPWRGKRVASMEAGHSHLARLLPRVPIALCEIVLLPAMIAAAGYALVLTCSYELGIYLVAGSISLCLMALWEARRDIAYQTATVDDLIRQQAYEKRFDDQAERERSRTSKARPQGPEFVNPDDTPPPPPPRQDTGRMTRAEALESLELTEQATPAEITAAYRRLMASSHPDKGGPTLSAKKLDQARDTLLR